VELLAEEGQAFEADSIVGVESIVISFRTSSCSNTVEDLPLLFLGSQLGNARQFQVFFLSQSQGTCLHIFLEMFN